MLDTVEIKDGGAARNAGLRIGLALSLITGRPLRLGGLVDDSPRPRPGLAAGGLTLAVAASAVSRGRLQAEAGSPELTLTPGGPPQPGDYHLDVAHLEPSCAPFSSMLEMLLLPLSMTGGTSGLILRGGSHVMGGPTSDEITKVFLPNWRTLGLNANYSEIAPGFFPSGGGEAEATIVDAGGALNHIKAEAPFQPREVGVEVLCSNLPVHLAEQSMQGALDRLAMHGLNGEGNLRRAKGGKGQALLVWASDGHMRIGFSTLGKRGSRPEALALEAVEAMTHFLKSQAGLPSALAARLLLTLACAKGISRFTVSGPPKPLKTAMKIINAFWPGTVRLSSPRDEALLEVKVIGRDWGRVL